MRAKNKGALRASFRTRAFRSGGYTAAIAAAAVAVAVLVNLLVNALPDSLVKLDTTRAELYTISDQTKQLLSSLNEDINVYCVAQTGNENETIKEMLGRYGDLSSHIKADYVDPVLYPTFTKAYTDETLEENSLIVVCGERSTVIGYDSIFTYEMNYETYVYDTYFYGEGLLTSAIDYVTRETLPKVCVLTGHGEDTLAESLTNAVKRRNMELSELNLVTAGAVPEDCQCLMIIGPDSDISAAELEALAAYREAGGNILAFTTYTETEMPRLLSLMSDCGAVLKDGIVVEGKSGYYMANYPSYIVPDFGEHEITAPLAEAKYVCLTPISQAIEMGDTPEGVTVSPLLVSSDEAYIKVPVDYIIDNYDYAEGDERGSFTVGAAISDTRSGTESRLVWYTGTYILDPEYDSYVSGANSALFLNSLDWMTEREDSIALDSKSVSVEYLSTTTSNTTPWAVILIGILPLGALAFGIVVHVRRKRR